MMQITEIKVFPIGEEKLKAFVSVVFDHCFMVNDIKVIQGREGLFISMPSRRKRNGKFKDVAHPLNNETRQMIEGQVLTEYDRVLAERAAAGGAAPGKPRAVAPVPATPPAAPRPSPAPQAAQPAPAPQAAQPAPTPQAAQPAPTPQTAQPAPAPQAAEPATGPEAAPEPAADPSPAPEAAEKSSLEEVTELHLRDSFWTT